MCWLPRSWPTRRCATAFATVPGVVPDDDFSLLECLHNVPNGTGLHLKYGIFGVIEGELGAGGVQELINIVADEFNKYTGSKFVRPWIGS